MEVKIQTLTPLWTGGVDAGKCDRIHETGILGSLRWWMEVLVRGVGGSACDPTEQKCSAKNGLCEVCKVFGAEGQKRRFRLEIQDSQVSDATIEHPIRANRTYIAKNGKQKTPTWYFPDPTKDKPQPPNIPKTGTFILKIQSLHPDFKPEVLSGLIQFIADWSALGARPQMGFGVIQVEGSRIDTKPLYDWLMTTAGSNTYLDLPSLQNIFLAKIQPQNSNSSFQEQDTFNLKYDLRQLFRTDRDIAQHKNQSNKPITKKDKEEQELLTKKDKEEQELRHFIMGIEKGDRQAAKIKISRPYDNDKLMRVWGWISEESEFYKNGWDREKVVDAIYQHLKANYTLTLHNWREMNSARNTVTTNQTDVQAFLRSLLQLQEET